MFTKMNSLGETILLVILCGRIILLKADFQQQQAKVVQSNPKYIETISIFTTRNSRSSPYSTDLNITTLADWGNNVTIKSMYYKHKAKSDAFAIEFKACDMIKLKWVRDWVEKYSNMSVDTCPVKHGKYRFIGFEVPPKNFPIHILIDKSTEYETTFLVYITKTKETILEITIGLKLERKTKGAELKMLKHE